MNKIQKNFCFSGENVMWQRYYVMPVIWIFLNFESCAKNSFPEDVCVAKKSICVENLENLSRESSENELLCFVFLTWYCESSWEFDQLHWKVTILPGLWMLGSIISWFIVENNEKRAANDSVVRDQIASKEDMAFTEEKFSKQLAISKLNSSSKKYWNCLLVDIWRAPHSRTSWLEDQSNVWLIGRLIKRYSWRLKWPFQIALIF